MDLSQVVSILHPEGESPTGAPRFVGRASRFASEVRPGDLYVDVRREGELREPPNEVASREPGVVLTDRPRSWRGVFGSARVVTPADPLEALARLGAARRAAVGPKVIGVTGSVGKSSTTQMIGKVLSSSGAVVETTLPSENDELGVPITCFNINDDVEFLVCEMATWRRGEIALCCRSARPDIAVITRIDAVHLSRFGSLDAIAAAKKELVEGLSTSGQLVVNVDDPYWQFLVGDFEGGILKYSTAGRSSDAYAIGEPVNSAGTWETRVWLERPGREVVLSTRAGSGNLSNAIAALAVATEAGIAPDDAAAVLSSLSIKLPGRIEEFSLPSGLVVVNDAYNASLGSCVELSEFMRSRGFESALLIYGGIAEAGDRRQELDRAALEALAPYFSEVMVTDPGINLPTLQVPTFKVSVDEVRRRFSASGIENDFDAVVLKGSNSAGLFDLSRELRKSTSGAS